MAVTAVMRVFGADEVDLEVEPLVAPRTWSVLVPGFGALVLGEVASPELIVRLAPPVWRAILVQPDFAGKLGPLSRHLERPVVVAEDGSLEVELLHKADRLCVVVRGVEG